MTQTPQPGAFSRLLRGLWLTVDGTRKVVLNLIFFFLLFVVIAANMDDGAMIIRSDTALILNPHGMVVEQYSTDATERAINRALDEEIPETRMRDLLQVIEKAASDDNISRLVISPDGMWGIGLSKLQELRAAIETFKASGKSVIAYSHGLGQHNYYLASLADEIWLHPEGLVFLDGYGVYRNFYKEGLDMLEVDVHLFRVGEYKSAAEPFVRNDMSEASKEANRYWLQGLWQDFLEDVSAQRDMTVDELAASVSEFSSRLDETGGDPAQVALQFGLVDKLATVDEFREHLIELGTPDDDNDSFRQISLENYLSVLNRQIAKTSTNKVAVVVAQGVITGGDQPSGTIGSESTTRLIRQARLDEVSALVLRVDSPGGGVMPSELIRREIEVTRTAGIPVVVSMSTVAASGGYWISMSADEIWANPATITGSIGIFGMLTNIPRTLAKIGIHTDGVGTTELAGAFRPDRELSPKAGEIIQKIIDDGYQKFIHRVAESRGMTPEEIDRIARGRVWSGTQAYDRGLIDNLGGLNDAIAAAADLAGVGEDYRVTYVEPEPTAFERFLLGFSEQARGLLSPMGRDSWLNTITRGPLDTDLQLLLDQRKDRLGVYAYCFCSM